MFERRNLARLGAAMAVLGLLLASCYKPELTPTYTVSVTSDVVYGQGEVGGGGTFTDLELDLYEPNVPGQDRFPLVVVIHGGGFYNGDKASAGFVQWSNEFASRGYVVASINYRLAGDDPVPSPRVQALWDAVGGTSAPAQFTAAVAAMDDTLTALDHLHELPQVAPSQTVLTGNSAGAITADYVGYAMDDFGIAPPRVSTVISNCGGFFASPGDASFLEDDEAPVFLTHTTGDGTVPYSLSVDIANRAQAVGVEYEFFTKNSNQHCMNLFTTEFSPGVSVFQAQVDFLDEVLIGIPSSD